MDDDRQVKGNPLGDLIRDGMMQAINAMEGQPYRWGEAGPGPITATKVGAVIPMSSEQYLDALSFEHAIRRAREIRQYLRELWLTKDTATAFRICQAYCLRVATITLADQRAYEAERCPHCGCHPLEHGGD